MSTVCGGDIPKPTSAHADAILRALWPMQSESAWGAFAASLKAEALRLFSEDDQQHAILQQVATDQDGPFIEAATRLVTISSTTLAARYKTYAATSNTADAVARRIWATKLWMAESVDNAENTITAAENELNPKISAAQAADQAALAAALKGELDGRTTATITLAQGEVVTAAAEGSSAITALAAEVVATQPKSHGSSAPAPPAAPMSSGGTGQSRPHGAHGVDYHRSLNGSDRAGLPESTTDRGHLPRNSRDARAPGPETTSGTPDKTGSPNSAPPFAASAPSSGTNSATGGSPSSVLASIIKPPASTGSPAAGAGSSSAAGSPSGITGPPGQPTTASRPGTGISRAISAASAGIAISETAARMGTGAIAATSSALGAATNTSGQVAQTTAAAPNTMTAPVTPPTAAPLVAMPSTATPMATGGPASPPLGAVPPPGGIPGSPVTPSPVAAAGSVPEPMPMTQMRALGGGSPAPTGEALTGQAAEAARSILETLIAQTWHIGYGGTEFSWAVSVIADRTGQFTAWLASSEGPSYVPRGVRLPTAVRLAVTDQVVGRELWETSAQRGGADPIKLLVQHAQMLDAAAPGIRVLALAAAVPRDHLADWAAQVGARPVSLDPRIIAAAAAAPGAGQHRCEAVMPWEWQQANTFHERKRRKVAAQCATAATEAGHLNNPACRRVIDAFTRGQAITESDWADITQVHVEAWVDYDLARMAAHAVGGSTDPSPIEWTTFRTARAAEVVQCLRETSTAAGFADLLYASRLAGAPLNAALA